MSSDRQPIDHFSGLGETRRYARLFSFLASLFLGPLARSEETKEAQYFYVRDSATEFVLTKGQDWGFELRHFGNQNDSADALSLGTLNRINGSLKYEINWLDEKEPGKKHHEVVEMTGVPGSATLHIQTGGIMSDRKTPIDLGGKFILLSNAEFLKRTRNRFDAADALLNKTYQVTKNELKGSAIDALREKQRAWIEYRNGIAEFHLPDPPQSSPDYWGRMCDLTLVRVRFLRIYSGIHAPKGLAGEYEDSYGGVLTLADSKAGLRFSIEVVRGPTAHTGEISGVARLTGNTAYFKAKADNEIEGPPAEVTLTFGEGHIVRVETKYTQQYGGMGAYFEGNYYKTANAQE